MKFFKITPFLIFFGIIEIILVFITLYYTFIENNGGMALAAAIGFIAIIIILIILLIERFIANSRFVNTDVLWIIELLIILNLIIYVYKNGISIG